jgi:imidazolonepropionase-like amidohydrolase
MLVQRKVWVDPTLVVFRNMLLLPDTDTVFHHPDNLLVPKRMLAYWHQYPNRSRLPSSTLEPRRRELQKYKELVGILYRAGVPLLAGTDTPCPYVPPGFSMHQELELLVESGMPPAAVLQAATIQGARVLKQSANLGSIEAGKLADIVILDADPLADIRNTRKINRVVRGGLVLDPKSLLQFVPTQ